MEDNLKASVTEVVGQILELRQSVASNKEQIKALRQQINTLDQLNDQIQNDIDQQRRLLDYVLETGEDPVAASLQLSQKEIERKTQQSRFELLGAVGSDYNFFDNHTNYPDMGPEKHAAARDIYKSRMVDAMRRGLANATKDKT
jgi:hypothetical protein